MCQERSGDGWMGNRGAPEWRIQWQNALLLSYTRRTHNIVSI